MNYLLDTHYMLWALTEPSKISKKITSILTDPANRIVVSTVTFWEVSLKASIGKLQLQGIAPEELPAACMEIGFELEAPSALDSSTYHHLTATHHKDPFDRMLIWQAIRHQYTLISVDDQVKKYISAGLKLV